MISDSICAISTRSSRRPTPRGPSSSSTPTPWPTPCTPTRSTCRDRQRRGPGERHRVQLRVLRTPRWQDRRRLLGGRRGRRVGSLWARRSSPHVLVSFVGDEPHIAASGDFAFFAGARKRAFFFDFDGIKNLFDIGVSATSPPDSARRITLGTGVDSNTEANVFSTAIEMPTGFLGADPYIRIWQVQRADRRQPAGTAPATRWSAASSTPDDTKEEYNASGADPSGERWIDMFIHQLGHTGYSREEAIEAINNQGHAAGHVDVQSLQARGVPNGRVFTDDVIDYRLSFLTKGDCPPSGLSPHTDTLQVLPYPGPATPVTLAGTRIGCQPLTGSLSLPSNRGRCPRRARHRAIGWAARWSPLRPASARPRNTTHTADGLSRSDRRAAATPTRRRTAPHRGRPATRSWAATAPRR